ncbi:MAG TPA: hypothetical protein PLY78_11305, partial [Methanospirillum sp.]|nr:hypothetical protein [Methanospirillum sp.]
IFHIPLFLTGEEKPSLSRYIRMAEFKLKIPGQRHKRISSDFLIAKKSGFIGNISVPFPNALPRMKTRAYRLLIHVFPTGYLAVPGAHELR